VAIAQYEKNMIGKRIRLQYTNDPYTNLKPGDEGVVSFIDDFGTISVNWDSGSTLGLNPEFGDRYVLIEGD
jgi:hypothetical protein